MRAMECREPIDMKPAPCAGLNSSNKNAAGPVAPPRRGKSRCPSALAGYTRHWCANGDPRRAGLTEPRRQIVLRCFSETSARSTTATVRHRSAWSFAPALTITPVSWRAHKEPGRSSPDVRSRRPAASTPLPAFRRSPMKLSQFVVVSRVGGLWVYPRTWPLYAPALRSRTSTPTCPPRGRGTTLVPQASGGQVAADK